jgi:hypothetical protein
LQIIINEKEIVKAIKQFISNQGTTLIDKSLDVSLTAGRGANGHSATIEVNDLAEEEKPVVQPRGGNTMQEGFALEKAKDEVAEKAIKEVNETVEKASVEKSTEDSQDDVDDLFGS